MLALQVPIAEQVVNNQQTCFYFDQETVVANLVHVQVDLFYQMLDAALLLQPLLFV